MKAKRLAVGGFTGSLSPQTEHFIRKHPLNSEPYIALADLHVDSYHFVRTLTLINEVFHLIGNKNKLQVLGERMFFIWFCFLSLPGQSADCFHMIVVIIC